MEKLECVFCQKKFPMDVFFPFCPICHEPMLVSYPSRKRSFYLDRLFSLEKFIDFLPLRRVNPKLSLDEGNTPLLSLTQISERLHLPPTFCKNEMANPTHSFKDRGTAVAVQKAVSLGIKKIGTVSTGNMAASTAAYGAKAGLKALIFIKGDSYKEKILSTGIHGPSLVKVKGDYGRLFYESYKIGEKNNIYFINSIDPIRIEGYKITAYEIFLQLKNQPPQYIFVPLSSGGHLIGLMRGFRDLRTEGSLERFPTFVGVQAHGCSPVSRAFASGKDRFKRIQTGNTVAHAISNPDPPGGNIVLKMIREEKGLLLDVTDREILDAQKKLAELEGIFCDPASATTLAGLVKLSRKRRLRTTERIVLLITGSGLKSMETLEHHKVAVHTVPLEKLEEKAKDLF